MLTCLANSSMALKKSKSTTTLGLQLQSLIARALDENNYILMASNDLSAAFDVVNVDLLISRIRIIGLPHDLVGLMAQKQNVLC